MEICYKNNFLTDVIVKIDFANPIKSLEDELPIEIRNKASEFFKIFEPHDVFGRNLHITGNAVTTEDRKQKNWIYYGKKREKQLIITSTAFSINYKTYETFEKLKIDFKGLLLAFFETFPDMQISRFGLRCINNIEINEGKPTSWRTYLNNNLLSMFKLTDNKYYNRAVQILELNYDDLNMRFQYGMYNPDFPSIIKRKIFLLDFDCYQSQIIDNYAEVLSLLENSHDKIQDLFELSIKDKLRKRLDND